MTLRGDRLRYGDRMMPSHVPIKATWWRITPSDLAGLAAEAERYLKSVSLNGDDGDQKVDVAWTVTAKDGRIDYPTGTADEVTAGLDVPRKHTEAVVQLSCRGRSIKVFMWKHQAQILLRSTNQEWLQITEPWAREAIAKFTPRWAWLSTWKGTLAFIGLIALLGNGSLYGLQALGVGAPVPLLVSAILQVMVLAVFISVISRPRVIVSDSRESRLRAIGSQALLLVVGALLGVLGQELFDLLFPPA